MTPEDKLYYVGQKAFIEKDGKVLVIGDPTEGLDYPGGKIQVGETDLVEALKREVREEVGMEIEVGEVFFTWTNTFPAHHRNAGKEVFLVAHKCKWVSGEITLSEEHDSFRWVDASNYRECDEGSKYFDALKAYYGDA